MVLFSTPTADPVILETTLWRETFASAVGIGERNILTGVSMVCESITGLCPIARQLSWPAGEEREAGLLSAAAAVYPLMVSTMAAVRFRPMLIRTQSSKVRSLVQ